MLRQIICYLIERGPSANNRKALHLKKKKKKKYRFVLKTIHPRTFNLPPSWCNFNSHKLNVEEEDFAACLLFFFYQFFIFTLGIAFKLSSISVEQQSEDVEKELKQRHGVSTQSSGRWFLPVLLSPPGRSFHHHTQDLAPPHLRPTAEAADAFSDFTHSWIIRPK